jgi:hypothetical protein
VLNKYNVSTFAISTQTLQPIEVDLFNAGFVSFKTIYLLIRGETSAGHVLLLNFLFRFCIKA